MRAVPRGTDWAIQQIVKITDGDSLRVIRRQSFPIADGLTCDVYDASTDGAPIRLVTLDTPERGQVGYMQAQLDVIHWITANQHNLRIETWAGGGFDRLLGDVYAGERSNTLSQWMLRERGWSPYVGS